MGLTWSNTKPSTKKHFPYKSSSIHCAFCRYSDTFISSMKQPKVASIGIIADAAS